MISRYDFTIIFENLLTNDTKKHTYVSYTDFITAWVGALDYAIHELELIPHNHKYWIIRSITVK